MRLHLTIPAHAWLGSLLIAAASCSILNTPDDPVDPLGGGTAGSGAGGYAATTCGDGVVEPGEQCDDEGESEDCDENCTFASCGDGEVNLVRGEECDDDGDSETCDEDCTAATCGDGYVNIIAGEDCDVPNETAECDADCTAVLCGDGHTNELSGEECDDEGDSETCDADCTLAVCGDGVVNQVAGEVCDVPGGSAECNPDCTSATCGDGVINTASGEECDDVVETEDCDANCTFVSCGDGQENATAGEICDDGNENDCDGCRGDCSAVETGCGDGFLCPPETCDDSNTNNGDGCSSACQIECNSSNANTVMLCDEHSSSPECGVGGISYWMDFDSEAQVPPNTPTADLSKGHVDCCDFNVWYGATQVNTQIPASEFDTVQCGPGDAFTYGTSAVEYYDPYDWVICLHTADGRYVKYIGEANCCPEIVLRWCPTAHD